jgi:hypothetical protein
LSPVNLISRQMCCFKWQVIIVIYIWTQVLIPVSFCHGVTTLKNKEITSAGSVWIMQQNIFKVTLLRPNYFPSILCNGPVCCLKNEFWPTYFKVWGLVNTDFSFYWLGTYNLKNTLSNPLLKQQLVYSFLLIRNNGLPLTGFEPTQLAILRLLVRPDKKSAFKCTGLYKSSPK